MHTQKVFLIFVALILPSSVQSRAVPPNPLPTVDRALAVPAGPAPLVPLPAPSIWEKLVLSAQRRSARYTAVPAGIEQTFGGDKDLERLWHRYKRTGSPRALIPSNKEDLACFEALEKARGAFFWLRADSMLGIFNLIVVCAISLRVGQKEHMVEDFMSVINALSHLLPKNGPEAIKRKLPSFFYNPLPPDQLAAWQTIVDALCEVSRTAPGKKLFSAGGNLSEWRRFLPVTLCPLLCYLLAYKNRSLAFSKYAEYPYALLSALSFYALTIQPFIRLNKELLPPERATAVQAAVDIAEKSLTSTLSDLYHALKHTLWPLLGVQKATGPASGTTANT